MNLAVQETIKEIGIEDDVINWRISAGTEEMTKITKEEYEELLRNGMPIIINNGSRAGSDAREDNRRKRRASGPVADGNNVILKVFK